MTNILSEAVKLLQANQAKKAEDLLSTYYPANLNNAQFLHLYGLAASDSGDYQSGIERVKKAIALNPKIAEFHHNLAAIYRLLGEFKLSEQCYLTALQLKPDYAEAYFNYSAAKKFTKDDPIVPILEQQLSRSDLSDEDRCFLGFAAGNIFNDIKEYDKAFSYYGVGNRSKNARFDINQFRSEIDQLISVFSSSFIQQCTSLGSASQIPVFILGMPRTGTTLVEQILSCHPEVHGAGELPDIASIAGTMRQHATQKSNFPECVTHLPDNIFSGFADAYLRRLRTFDQSAVRIINKMPPNFLYLGLITIMFPEAKIIHCQRHPLDTCLSCYFQRFRRGHDYSFNLKHLGLYYREYERLMEHWRNVLPVKPYELHYSELVANQEEQSRSLIDFIDVSWNERCLNFQENIRPVTTASNLQVRRPMNRSGLDRWKNYDRHLGILRDALGISETE
ncbi:tetratricopeptide repeat-containing sulfotransferase family protein [Gimesia aquarii]|uniref:Sulfotransferase domain protein n=1 Tax=Gimesia aquarii TaxID=2527964 RepID=A0A517WZH6_9PLAN|nr:sulfotransferase family protein [Gimesia aquarii]QDU10657.1 Sulfotransferase domain protein [Gimesia aquarii]